MHKFDPEYICKQPLRATPTTVPPIIKNRGKSTQYKVEKGSTVAIKRMTSTTFNPLEYFILNLLNMSEKDSPSQEKLLEFIYTCHKVYKERFKSYVKEGQPIRNYNETEWFNLLALSLSSPASDLLETFLSQSSSTRELCHSSSEIYPCPHRYEREFNEINPIAEGGFGRVYHAQNKIDECSYAVKKICLRYRNSQELFRSLKEARTLAKLDHCNIVIYKSAWLEVCPISSREESSASSSCSPGYKDSDSERMKTEDEIKDGGGEPMHTIKSSDEPMHTIKSSISSESNLDISFKEGIHCDPKSSKECLEQKSQLHDSCKHAMLFIQMQLCKETLRHWLDQRNGALNNSKNLDHNAVCIALYIFQEILNGMEYVHKKEIIHHDLKPSNIFVDGIQYCPCDSKNKGKVNGEVRLGDFGLACHYAFLSRSTEDDNKAIALNPANLPGESSCIIEKGLHPSMTEKEIIGTEMYSAPEQLEGRCNLKSDIYSLGIILLELLHPFTTYMERSKKIKALRSEGLFPEFFEQRYPLVASLITKLTSNDVKDRPCINDVMKMFTYIVENFENETSEGDDGILNGNNAIQKENDTKYVKEYSLSSTPGTSSGCSSQTYENFKKEQQAILAELEEKNAAKDKEIMFLVNQVREIRNYAWTLQNNSSHGWNIARKLRKEKEKKEEIIKELQEKVEKLEIDCQKNRHAWNISKKLKKENLEKHHTIMKQNRQINLLKSICKEKDEDITRMQNENASIAEKNESLYKLKLEMKPWVDSEDHFSVISHKRKTCKNFKKGASKMHRLQSGTPLSDLLYM